MAYNVYTFNIHVVDLAADFDFSFHLEFSAMFISGIALC